MVEYDSYREGCIAFLQKLVQTPSVNGEQGEKDISQVIAEEARKLGLPFKTEYENPERPNVFVGEGFENDKNLLLVAHTDTVSVGDVNSWENNPFSGLIKGDRLYGRGAVDCKGGIALSLYVLKILKDLGKLDAAKFVGVADEESGGDSPLGLKSLLAKGLKARGAVYTYGGGDSYSRLTIGHRGWIRLWISSFGESTHTGSTSWHKRIKGENAIDGIVDLLVGLRDYELPQQNPYFPDLGFTLTPTMIEGGRGESIVPDHCKLLIDIRTLPEHNNKQIIDDLTKLVGKLSKDKKRFEVTIKNNVSAALTDPGCSLVQKAKELSQTIFGEEPQLVGSGPGNESYMLINNGIPTIVGFGPLGGNSHSPNEYADLSSINNSLKFLTELALQS